ncbi:MAG: Periplasmic divalent cation tolerance protein CutA, partial [uncultured Gemmatimonadetes bacterium]
EWRRRLLGRHCPEHGARRRHGRADCPRAGGRRADRLRQPGSRPHLGVPLGRAGARRSRGAAADQDPPGERGPAQGAAAGAAPVPGSGAGGGTGGRRAGAVLQVGAGRNAAV